MKFYLSLFGDGGDAAESTTDATDANNANNANNANDAAEKSAGGGNTAGETNDTDTAEDKDGDSAEENGRNRLAEEFRRMRELSRQKERLLRTRIFELGESRRNDAAINEYRSRLREADELKTEFPGFDIRTEVKDPRFRAMIESGIDLRSAYTALHSRDVVDAAIEQSRNRMTSEIIQRSARPAENGTSDQSAAVGKPDISSLSRSEIEAIERRVARGEKIYLK